MGLGMEVKQSQKLDIQQSLEQKQSLHLAFTQRLEELFRSTPDAPEQVVDDVLGRAFGALPPASRKLCESALGAFPDIGKEMMKHSHLLALTNDGRLNEFAMTVLYTTQDGQFFDDDHSKERRASLVDILKTLRDRSWAEREREHVRSLMATQVGAGGGLVDDYRRLEKSLQITELLKPYIDQLVMFVRLALGAKDPQTGETIQACVREQAVMQKFIPLASERVERRLVASMQKIGANDPSERFENVALNAVGESLLVGLGVLAPELFELQHFSDEARESSEREFARLGYDPNALRRLFGEKKKTGVFWHRWKTASAKPGALTDLAVREFITEHLRKDKNAILEASEYPEFFARAQELSVERRTAKGADDRAFVAVQLEIQAAEFLGSEKLHGCLKRLSAGSWYRDLDTFFQKR